MRSWLKQSETLWLLPPLLALLPHLLNLPVWLGITCVVFWAWRAWLAVDQRRLPHPAVRILLALASLLVVAWQFGTLWGQQGGVPLFILLLFIKLLETEKLAEKRLLLILTQFVGMTYFLSAQSLPVTLYLLGVAVLSVAAMIHLQAVGRVRLQQALRQALVLFAGGLPLALLLFLFFPRLDHPLWQFPQDEQSARTGLSDTMRPGDFANLIQSTEVAFRAELKGAPIQVQQLYWRGPVLADFDGRTWHALPMNAPFRGQVSPLGDPVQVTLTLEPHQREWLFSPGLPQPLPAQTSLANGLQWRANTAVSQRQRWAFTAWPRYQHLSPPQERAQSLVLPDYFNPRAQALAKGWASKTTPSAQSRALIVQRALDYYHASFAYTLRPPTLGVHSIDDFLFASKRGFCEHFAGSFVFLMRAAGIPARVVTGYLGGEINPLDGHVVVRQSEAHAWAEVWLDDAQGWVQVDPTAAVSPSRVERGIGAALPSAELPPGLVRLALPGWQSLRHGWEMLNNGWNQWVLGYSQAQQLKLLALLSPSLASTSGLASATIAAGFLGLAIIAWWAWRRRPKTLPDPAARAWKMLEKKLARAGHAPLPGEAPQAFADRIGALNPQWKTALQVMVTRYLASRYGGQTGQYAGLIQAVKNFRPQKAQAGMRAETRE